VALWINDVIATEIFAGARPEYHVWVGGLSPRHGERGMAGMAWWSPQWGPGQSPWSGGQGGEAPLKLKTF